MPPRPPEIAVLSADHPDSDLRKAFLERVHAIRKEVFVDEQQVPSDLEWDDFDTDATHFLLLPADTHVPSAGIRSDEADAFALAVGTARSRVITADVGHSVKVERVAVLRSSRRLGFGAELMQAIEAHAREARQTDIRLNAQLTAAPFYDQLGYQREGAHFFEAGIEHVAMCKPLR